MRSIAECSCGSPAIRRCTASASWGITSVSKGEASNSVVAAPGAPLTEIILVEA